MIKTLLRPALIVIPLAVGFCFPEAGKLAYSPYYVVRWTLSIMIFLAALGITWRDLKIRREHWNLLAANIALGLIPFALVRYCFPEYRDLAQALFFIGITPTAAASTVIISLLNGRVGFSLTGFVISNLGISLALLFLLPWTTGNFSAEFCTDVARTILTVIVLPIGAAQLCRHYRNGFLKLRAKLKMFSLLLWSLSLFILSGVARQYFIDHPGESLQQALIFGGTALLFCIANFWCGAQVSGRKFRRECSQLLGQKNTVFSICLALEYANALVALALIFYIAWHNIYNAAQLYQYDRRKKLRHNRDNQ